MSRRKKRKLDQIFTSQPKQKCINFKPFSQNKAKFLTLLVALILTLSLEPGYKAPDQLNQSRDPLLGRGNYSHPHPTQPF